MICNTELLCNSTDNPRSLVGLRDGWIDRERRCKVNYATFVHALCTLMQNLHNACIMPYKASY